MKAIDAEKEVWVTCKECNHRTAVAVPDHSSMMRAVDTWLNYGFGRYVDQKREPTAEERAEARVAAMTDEELRGHAFGFAVDTFHRMDDDERDRFLDLCGLPPPASSV